jgi:preprotein translocase subunit YajC
MELIFPLLIVFMIGMIFVSNRQRKKQAQQQEQLQNSIAVGDIVVMTSGISGTVVDTEDEKTIDLEIAPDVVTTWLRAAVREKIGGEVELVEGVDGVDLDGTATGPDAVEATPADAPGTTAPSTTAASTTTPATGTSVPAAGATTTAPGTSGTSTPAPGATTGTGSTAAGSGSDGVTAGSPVSGERRSS